MAGIRDIWGLVHDWRYTGKAVNATDEQLWFDSCADLLEKAIESSDIVPRSRWESAERDLAAKDQEMAKRSKRYVEVVGILLAATEKAKAALISGQPGPIVDGVLTYNLDGMKCGSALDAIRESIAAVKETQQ